MDYQIRNSIKAVLLNDVNELLLLYINDSQLTTIDNSSRGAFWCLSGGKVEDGESVEQAIRRELFEETGITNLTLGPIVWYMEYMLKFSGVPTQMKQQFIVAKTKTREVSFDNLTQEELGVVKKAQWFSLEQINESSDIIYPVTLPRYLPDIIVGNYPEKMLKINA